MGPNGSGKTTTLKSIIGLIDFDKGAVEITGLDINKKRKTIFKKIGAVLEGARNIYWELSPLENLEYFSALKGVPFKKNKEIDNLLRVLELEEVKKKPVREFSRGMQQKVALACSLVSDPEILFLDEPTLGLDVATTRSIKKYITSKRDDEGKTILVTSHDMKFMEDICDRVLIIKDGKIITHESIETLKKQHSHSIIELELVNKFSKIQRELISSNWKTEDCNSTNGGEKIKITLTNINEIYQLMSILSSENSQILSMTNKQAELEEIFLSLTSSADKEDK